MARLVMLPVAALALSSAMVGSIPSSVLTASAQATTTYIATETIPVPPASNYAGAGGGDGWSIALSNTQVFNVFHHDSLLEVSCHNQSDATACYPVRTITDGSGNNFVTSGHPGLFLDQNTGKLYVYVNRPVDSTAGVVCVDTAVAAVNPNPFCGYTSLTAVNDGPPCCGWGGLSNPIQIGTKLYAYNFVNNSGTAGGSGGQNTLLCFDLTIFAACAGQPITVDIGSGTVAVGAPTPAIAGIGAQIVIPIDTAGRALLACWDAGAGTNCSGSWPVGAPSSYPGNAGAPFAQLDPTGKLIGLCLPTGTDECYSLTGVSVATPPGMTAAIGSGSVSWDGTGLVLGPRVYVPAWSNVIYCYDSSTSASCANFPKFFNNLSLLYTVSPDPRRPTCFWVNADNGSAQIQNFDAYTGGACGSGPIRVLASSIVVPTQLCTPVTYTSLQVLSPSPGSYTSGTVAFEDPDGNPISGAPVLTLDATGTVSLNGLSLNSALGLPEFLITLTGPSTRPSSVTVQLTWTGVGDPSCTPAGAPKPLTITTTSLPAATWGSGYQTAFGAAGGSPPYRWTVPSGHLPTMTPLCLGTGPGAFCYPLFDPTNGTLSGVPQYAGTYSFRVMVTDAAGAIATKVFAIVVNTDIPAFSRLFTLAYRGGPVLLNPHVAIVLVDPNSGPSWWSPGITTSSSEPGTLLGAVSNLVTSDYSSGYGTPLSTYTDSAGNKVGRLSLCSYTNGTNWFGPVRANSVPSPSPGDGTAAYFRKQVIPVLNSTCSSDVTNTIFLMLYAPAASTCSDLGGNTNDTSQGIHEAWIRLFDQGNNCPFMPSMQFEPTALQSSVDFATFAVSHELDEGITDPLGSHNSWLAIGLNASGSPHAEQIADWCTDRNAEGATTYAPDNPAAGPYFNYTRDNFGTVVAAYMSTDGEAPRDGEVALCIPDVSAGIPPG